MTRANQTERLQDEVYRQMLRLEAGCSAADLQLAIALLRAWMLMEHEPPRSRPRQWLRAVCPLCLHMIAREDGSATREVEPATPRSRSHT
jgi:hypothetical protein